MHPRCCRLNSTTSALMSRRDHTAYDLANLRIDLFGETAKASSTPVFGRKGRGTFDKRGNTLATTPFMKRKRKTVEMESFAQGEPREPAVLNTIDEALDSRPPKKKRCTYYPGILPYLDISEGPGNTIFHLKNEQSTAVSIHLPLGSIHFIHPVLGTSQEDTLVRLRVPLGSEDAIRCCPRTSRP